MPATGASTGSSPRVRGTLAAQGGVAAVGGIIPACAGTPCYRRRGSDRNGIIPACAGTPCYRRRGSDRNGIIPACAGNTGRRCGCHEHVRDHPRVCGEHKLSLRKPYGAPGSSPRVRGTRSFDDPVHRQRGIIPACAGNTGSSLVRWVRSSGSSPRVRGTLPRPVHRADHEGIIPACAGNTIWLRPSRRGSGDHPRVCGEH